MLRPPPHAPALIVLVASTGGPRVLGTMLPLLLADLLTPVCIVQHMATSFIDPWTRRLTSRLGRVVEVAVPGRVLRPRSVWVAGPGRHFEVRRDGCQLQTALGSTQPHAGCTPSGTVLLESAVAATGGRVSAAILTGMGWDGAQGAEAAALAGGRVFLQSEASSTVYGMPRAAAERLPDAPRLTPRGLVAALRADAWIDPAATTRRAQ